MKMNYKLTDYFSDIRTREETEAVIEELTKLANSVYKNGKDSFDQVLHTEIRKITADKVREIIKNQNTENNMDKKAEVINNLINGVKSFEKFEITLAIEPTKEITDEIVKWLEKNIKPGVIAEIVCNTDIIAGVKIVYNGKYFDYSWSKHWDQMWSKIEKELEYAINL